MSEITFKDSNEAFTDAIIAGHLSADPNKENFAGNFMYMGTTRDGDLFKNIVTRRYLDCTQKCCK